MRLYVYFFLWEKVGTWPKGTYCTGCVFTLGVCVAREEKWKVWKKAGQWLQLQFSKERAWGTINRDLLFSIYRWNDSASSSVYYVDLYVIIINLLDPNFDILLIFVGRFEIETCVGFRKATYTRHNAHWSVQRTHELCDQCTSYNPCVN
jgi:hypothetical protein